MNPGKITLQTSAGLCQLSFFYLIVGQSLWGQYVLIYFIKILKQCSHRNSHLSLSVNATQPWLGENITQSQADGGLSGLQDRMNSHPTPQKILERKIITNHALMLPKKPPYLNSFWGRITNVENSTWAMGAEEPQDWWNYKMWHCCLDEME